MKFKEFSLTRSLIVSEYGKCQRVRHTGRGSHVKTIWLPFRIFRPLNQLFWRLQNNKNKIKNNRDMRPYSKLTCLSVLFIINFFSFICRFSRAKKFHLCFVVVRLINVDFFTPYYSSCAYLSIFNIIIYIHNWLFHETWWWALFFVFFLFRTPLIFLFCVPEMNCMKAITAHTHTKKYNLISQKNMYEIMKISTYQALTHRNFINVDRNKYVRKIETKKHTQIELKGYLLRRMMHILFHSPKSIEK